MNNNNDALISFDLPFFPSFSSLYLVNLYRIIMIIDLLFFNVSLVVRYKQSTSQFKFDTSMLNQLLYIQ